MDFLKLVKDRYSCRAYEARSVEKEKLDYVMECVRMAPSAVNKQPWRFHVVCREEDRAKLRQCYNREWFTTAPMYIIASVLPHVMAISFSGSMSIPIKRLCFSARARRRPGAPYVIEY